MTVPFKSRAQKGWMYANHPEMAKKWQEHTPQGLPLPEHVKHLAPAKKPARKKVRKKQP